MRPRSSLFFATVFLAAAFCVAYAAGDCSVTITQTLGSGWQQDGKDYSQWNAQLTAGSEGVKSVLLSIATNGATITQLWELNLNASTGLYSLPAYRLQNGGLSAGETHRFGYIWTSASKAAITVSSINCGTATTTPTTTPSAMPSITPIVSTPAPSPSSGCSLTVSQTKRSAAEGGSWTTGDFGFQIYDLVLSNNGQRPANAARINVSLPSSAQQQIYQFWNVERASADSTEFAVPTPWGSIQVGASQGAGYIIRFPLSAASQQADPSVSLLSVSCDGSPSSPSPSASPSAVPTIVSTPQPSSAPSGCSASVSIGARSTQQGGSWQANGANFQIFDLTIANTGSKAVTGGELTFTLPDGTTIFQWWELMSIEGSANVLDVSFNYGPLQVGATQGAGIVGKSASTTQAVPTVSIGSLTCA